MSLKEDFKSFIKKNGVSQNAAARNIGYTGSVISAWLNGSYAGDVAQVEQKVAIWMEREGKRRTIKATQIVRNATLASLLARRGLANPQPSPSTTMTIRAWWSVSNATPA